MKSANHQLLGALSIVGGIVKIVVNLSFSGNEIPSHLFKKKEDCYNICSQYCRIETF